MDSLKCAHETLLVIKAMHAALSAQKCHPKVANFLNNYIKAGQIKTICS